MNEEEKKAVEFVKKRTKELKKYAKRENELVYDDIILNLINKLQKENEELKADNYELNNRITDLLENIPVQKVKDKIEKILNNGEYRIIFEGDAEFPDEATCIDAQKYIKLEKLQELLEGRK